MPRKRKVAVNNEQKSITEQLHRKEIMQILYNVQSNETYHKKYNKQLQNLYEKMDHDDFTATFILCLKQLMQQDPNQYNNTGIKFMAKFVTSFQAEDMHPLFDSIFQWILQTVSLTPSVRLRLCEFINLMLDSLPDDGDIEEFVVNEIITYMFDRLKDISPHVRVQAIKALCRLQIKEDPDDMVTKIFLFHLEHDPSPLVRQAVISSIARSVHTIPFILDRLWDVDVKVRRSVLAHLSNFSLNLYTIEQRLTLLEQGLTDDSETVRNITTTVLLRQWLDSCGNNFITFLSSLKLDSNEAETTRFRSIARLSLFALFKSQDPSSLINVLPLTEINNDDDTNNHNCIQMDKLTPELCIFWSALIEFFQNDESKCEYLEQFLPDLTTFCNYITTFSRQIKNGSSANICVSRNIFFTLIEILNKFDLSDEVGRQNVQNVVVFLLTKRPCAENQIQCLIEISEKLIPVSSDRLQFYADIVQDIINPIDMDASLVIASNSEIDPNSELQVASLKIKLFELKEKETKCLEVKDYDKLTEIKEEINLCNEQITNLITPFLPCEAIPSAKRLTTECILRALQLTFYGVCSKTVSQLIPSTVQLYKDVIRVRVESKNENIRNWALKCTATFSLLYVQLASDAYRIFCKQLLRRKTTTSIWITSIGAIFQLIDRYGFERFSTDIKSTECVGVEKSFLSVTSMCQSLEELHDQTLGDKEYGEDMMLLFDRYLDSIHDIDLTCELVDGFCMLILHGRFFDEKIMSKLLIMFYNTNTEPKIIQILSIFFEMLIQQKKQKYIQLALFETLTTITSDTLLIDIQPHSVIKFILHSTITMKAEENLHDELAVILLNWMDGHSSDLESLNLISKELQSLKVSANKEIIINLIDMINQLLEKQLYKKTEKNLIIFKEMMEAIGTEQLTFSSTQPAPLAEEVELHFSNKNSDEEIEPEEYDDENEKSKIVDSVENIFMDNNNENERTKQIENMGKGQISQIEKGKKIGAECRPSRGSSVRLDECDDIDDSVKRVKKDTNVDDKRGTESTKGKDKRDGKVEVDRRFQGVKENRPVGRKPFNDLRKRDDGGLSKGNNDVSRRSYDNRNVSRENQDNRNVNRVNQDNRNVNRMNQANRNVNRVNQDNRNGFGNWNRNGVDSRNGSTRFVFTRRY